MLGGRSNAAGEDQVLRETSRAQEARKRQVRYCLMNYITFEDVSPSSNDTPNEDGDGEMQTDSDEE